MSNRTSHVRPARGAAVLAALLTSAVFIGACRSKPPRPHPVLVVGIDGADWSAIRQLWKQGRMPALKKLTERGVAARMGTGYGGKSPPIWTTIATGVGPERHGITDFVVHGPKGDAVASATMRKVPAIWNIASASGLRVAVVGWWATWPAEPINGVVISDRALFQLPDRVWPAEWLPRFKELVKRSKVEPTGFPRAFEADNDPAMALAARELVAEDFDLVLVYLRDVDFTSHLYWKYFRPKKFRRVDPAEIEKYGDYVPQSYVAADAILGDLIARAPGDTNVFVMSDHGFFAVRREKTTTVIDFDPVLETLGFLTRDTGGVDKSKSRLFTVSSPRHHAVKKVRFNLVGRENEGTVRTDQKEDVRKELDRALAGVTYESGAPVFSVRDPMPHEAEAGADFVAMVKSESASERLLVNGMPAPNIAVRLRTVSGNHNGETPGIFAAAGPDIAPGASIERIHVDDMAPTILYALGLPVAEDFAGKPCLGIFTPERRERVPLRTVKSWGQRQTGAAEASVVDEELKEQLRALGYLE